MNIFELASETPPTKETTQNRTAQARGIQLKQQNIRNIFTRKREMLKHRYELQLKQLQQQEEQQLKRVVR